MAVSGENRSAVQFRRSGAPYNPCRSGRYRGVFVPYFPGAPQKGHRLAVTSIKFPQKLQRTRIS